MSYQPKNWRWCEHCKRDTAKRGHTPFCPATQAANAAKVAEYAAAKGIEVQA